MFRQSRRKIVVAMMAGLLLLMAGTLGIIYGSSYYQVSLRNYDMLNVYIQMYSLERQPGSGNQKTTDTEQWMNKTGESGASEFQAEDKNAEKGVWYPQYVQETTENMPSFELSTFYSVAIADDGEILATNNHTSSIYSNEQLVQFAQEIIEKEKTSGTKNSLLYCMEERDSYILVAFMNNGVIQESVTTLFRYTLLFGGIAIVILFLLARYWAKQIVAPLEENYQKQKQFVSDAGHELKTPLAAIQTNAEMLEKEIGNSQWLVNIQCENQRMVDLVGQMLELARSEKVEQKVERISLDRMIREEILMQEPIAFEKGMRFHSELEEGVTVSGDSIQLKQLLSILLDNAISYGDTTAPIQVRLKTGRSEARLQVINAGEEIPSEERELIFERFYRRDMARTSDDGHYGLGLAIAKNIVWAHKGTIGVDCHDGQIEFWVMLPF